MWSTVAKSPFLVKFFIILKYVYHVLFIIVCTYWFLKMHSLRKWMWSLQKKKGSRWLIKNLNKLDRFQWESNPDLCKGCTVPSLGILWTHNNWPDFQLALLALWIEHYVQSSQRSRFDSWYEFFLGLYQPLRLFIQQREPPPFPFISSWKFNYDLFHIFLVNPVFVTPFVMKGNG